MKYVTINNRTFGLATDFKHNVEIRTSFNLLTEEIYGFTFEEWYQQGYWGDRYIPYSLLDGDRVISNVSVNIIEFIIEGRNKTGIQIGTVMTDEKYRNQGLNKFLLKQVVDEWKGKSDFIYLFANDSVLEFYPKFGFELVPEYQHSKLITVNNIASNVKKLDMDDEKEREFLIETIKNSIPVSKVSMHDNNALIMFYCTSFMKNNIYYVDELESVVIADFVGGILYIKDVFSIAEVSLRGIVAVIAKKDTKKAVLGFTPIDETDYQSDLLIKEDILFVLKDQVDLFRDKHWMFPVLSHA